MTHIRRFVAFASLAVVAACAVDSESADPVETWVLTETLRDLERDGLVIRHVYGEVPPRVDYELTALGRTLYAPLQALGLWAEEHFAEVLAARERYDARQRP